MTMKKIATLASYLRKPATGILSIVEDTETLDLKTFLEKLEERFEEYLRQNSYSLFQTRRQELGGDFPTLAADIRKLAALAYPECSLVKEKISCSQFITGYYRGCSQ